MKARKIAEILISEERKCGKISQKWIRAAVLHPRLLRLDARLQLDVAPRGAVKSVEGGWEIAVPDILP